VAIESGERNKNKLSKINIKKVKKKKGAMSVSEEQANVVRL
jgi:hypothetical protein